MKRTKSFVDKSFRVCVALIAFSSMSAAGASAGDDLPSQPQDCSEPAACTLKQAARHAGVGIGLHEGNGAASQPGVRDKVVEQADFTSNHCFSWRIIWPERDRWDFSCADSHHAFYSAAGLREAAFHFAWDQRYLDDLAEWVLDIDDPDELRAVLHERARTIFERYPDLYRINVVNEPLWIFGNAGTLYPNHFYEVLGPDYVADLFEIVDAYAPEDTLLVLNENFVEYWPGKAEGLVRLVTDLVERGVPIDSVGFQTHLMLTEHLGREPDFELLENTMRRIADLGLDVWISELDNPVDPDRPDRLEYQAHNYRKAVEACLAVPRCSDVMVWGVEDEPYWSRFLRFDHTRADPYLFDRDLRPKPAWYAVVEALLAGRPTQASTTTSPSTTVSQSPAIDQMPDGESTTTLRPAVVPPTVSSATTAGTEPTPAPPATPLQREPTFTG